MLNPYQFQYHPQRDFSQILEAGAQECPDRTAVICGSSRITYGAMNQRINRLAHALYQLADGRQLRVGIISKNCIEYLELFLACARSRMIAVNMNWRCTAAELNYLVRQTDSQILFYNLEKDDVRTGLLKEFQDRLPMFNMDRTCGGTSEYESFLAQGEASPLIVDGSPDDVFSYYHTSGSSGIPKIVVSTHRELLKKIKVLVEGERFEYGTVFQAMTQLFHAGSLGNYMCFACRGTLILFNHFNASAYLASLERERADRITVAPSTLRALLYAPDFTAYDLSHLKCINYSMAPMPDSLINYALKLLPGTEFMGIYGMTEMAGGVTVLEHDGHFIENGRFRSSVGLPMSGMEIRVTDENGAPCAPGVIGEIAIRGCGQMKEYYRNPDATSQALRNGWLYSNDMGYLDESGYLFLCGRRSNMIITGGENVFSTEVENVLLEHDNIREAAVFGIPDDQWGEKVCACVVCADDSVFSEQELQQFCRQRIAGYKTPKAVFCVKKLPRNAVGKVLHRLLTERYSS